MSYWYYSYTVKNNSGFTAQLDSVVGSIDDTFPIMSLKDCYEQTSDDDIKTDVMVNFAIEISENDYMAYCRKFLSDD